MLPIYLPAWAQVVLLVCGSIATAAILIQAWQYDRDSEFEEDEEKP